ncbi:SOUL heme-binding protein [Seminavis robusta]|uniref:SOUL heme-binding protein n=1 Tax=Seminavis robusta TaxID=568900 RepID=A0A9N8H0A0_9STRA|nr:SOUL heme-binding protein [Seminavis robusta]|eukprot:Sro17_g012240.1 SOUL heme-binding protein (226) ;mRNA; f:61920-62597
MGSVFGRESVAEPAFEVLLERAHGPVQTTYEIRRYGERFAAETTYTGDGDNSPFRLLAQYIGVFGNPQNEASESISMTAPVMKSGSEGGTAIAMTAPVMRSANHKEGEKTMQFVLPAEYDELSKIPKPTNPKVHIKEIPPQVGAVHRYSGSMDDSHSEKTAMELAAQLRKDGVEISDADALRSYNFWGYNPPFCLPAFRRNEVWIELTTDQAEQLVKEFNPEDVN